MVSKDVDHQGWLALVEVSGPFLSLPVLRATWPALDAVDKQRRDRLRLAHTAWQQGGDRRDWIEHVLRGLLRWDDAVHIGGLDHLALDVPEHETTITPSFALAVPGHQPKPDTVRLLGMITSGHPTARMKHAKWAATPADRMAQLCRHHGVELGLVTDGRWWTLVWAPRGGVTTTATFDAIPWPEAAERDVLRAFVSLLGFDRFFSFPDSQRLPALLKASLDSQEDITEALGVQVRQAVELLVAAIGRAGVPDDVTAHEVYRGSVSVMMRVVFLLFAEERGLLPSDNKVYATAYSAGRLCAELEQRAIEGSEEELENSHAAWHRLLALFRAVHSGVEHPRLTMHAHDGSLFDPDAYAWMPLTIDDRTVMHMLRAVQYVEVGSGKNRERRTLSFRMLDVEQIGYVYEGLLSFDGFRAADVVVGLVGKPGREEEVELHDLEALARNASGDLAEKLAEKYKDSGIGSVAALRKRLAPLDEAGALEATRRLLAVTGGDADLARRLLPFAGLLRDDLRGLPVVILPGALYVTESALRKNTGTHYTPKFLAEDVVKNALEPLVYSPGPLQTADRSQWKLRSSAEIVGGDGHRGLKIADIAMGSAAFLVAAARYLGDRLVEAWSQEGREEAAAYLETAEERTADADADPVVIEARRQVIEHCLYGVDINPMAVEMAKLSLWLVSMDSSRPFTFVDDRLVVGDALLGITSLEQLEYMHLVPARGRKLFRDSALDFTADVQRMVRGTADKRRRLVDISVEENGIDALNKKRSILFEIDSETRQHRLFADLLVGASLKYAVEQGKISDRDADPEVGKLRGFDRASLEAAHRASAVVRGEPGSWPAAEEARKEWLATDQVPGTFDRRPVHWPLVFPEVFEEKPGAGLAEPGDVLVRSGTAGAGFDAIIGNPPFLGGSKISGSSGSTYREYLVSAIAGGIKGNADLIAYFMLRAHGLLNELGQTGLIATNTLAQGDTREVSLDQITSKDTIRRAVKSKPWPSRSAVLEYCAVWTSRAPLGEKAEKVLDGEIVSGIKSSLDSESRADGNPHRLIGSAGIAIFGTYVLGLGFTMEPGSARELIDRDSHNEEVLFPYLNGQDLNSRPDCSASRWIVNFQDWSEERAKDYSDCYEIVLRYVKPEREQNNNPQVRERWWQYKRPTVDLYKAIAELERVIVITLVSKVVMPVMVPTGQVFSHALGVFATDDTAMLALLSSAPHYWWARARASSMKADLRYTPSDVFETLPLPELTEEMRELGDRLDTYRRELMLARQAGLTATYNLVNDPACQDEDIVELRRIHRNIDAAVCRAYGWDDMLDKLDHGFHAVGGRETRYTVGPYAQREFVDLLLELNHARYAEEVAKGLHDKKKPAKAKPAKPARASKDPDAAPPGLF
ncbi:Eco57I restriction-modification methylase domain-containing protein [Microbispora hainanensis]|uniref:site-specific DNA-methyltransferase (adenine-specific) n=1 Tax=Microbispora hainanensis TaxID=568844 RepID=A0ABZ1SUU5_9ACTN|nr:type IIL restriction-modification enzyme MmeI [Microbispora hainanensis]